MGIALFIDFGNGATQYLLPHGNLLSQLFSPECLSIRNYQPRKGGSTRPEVTSEDMQYLTGSGAREISGNSPTHEDRVTIIRVDLPLSEIVLIGTAGLCKFNMERQGGLTSDGSGPKLLRAQPCAVSQNVSGLLSSHLESFQDLTSRRVQ